MGRTAQSSQSKVQIKNYGSYLVSDVHMIVHRDIFLIIKPTRCTNYSI